jgi:hypothetical protein
MHNTFDRIVLAATQQTAAKYPHEMATPSRTHIDQKRGGGHRCGHRSLNLTHNNAEISIDVEWARNVPCV